MPLHFTLLFPHGDDGYSLTLTHTDNSQKRVSPRAFFAWHFNVRENSDNHVFQAGRLFQEFISLSWVLIETQRLNWHKQNQTALRGDVYQNVKDFTEDRRRPPTGEDQRRRPLIEDDQLYGNDNEIGKKVILSSSLPGSPRWYNCQFQNAMAIVREYHKPDLFITMTCNPK